MTNKGKLKYFALGILVASLWFLVIGGVCLLIGTGILGTKDDRESGAVTDANVQKIEHFQRLLETYYYEDVSREELADGVLYGLMETVGDPYTCYYSVEEMEELTADIEGIFHGIGAYLEMDYDKGYAKISGIIDGTPASQSDIKVGDYVIKVDGVDTYEMTLTDVVAMIRGDAGTQVTLTLNRGGAETEVTVTRQNIETPTVEYELLENDIRLYYMSAKDAEKVVVAYEPIWAIGTGKTATSDQAEEVCGGIRAILEGLYNAETAKAVTIQYGGSMNAGNAKELLGKPNIDGGLIGGAALKAEDFTGIVKY